MTTRTDLEQDLHRLANHIECQLAEVLPPLLADSRVYCVALLTDTARVFIEALRQVRDGKDGAV